MFVIQTDYKLNIKAIADTLCINKPIPAMHCNGKCYLAKQLKESEQNDKQQPATKKAKLDISLFITIAPQQLPAFQPHIKAEYFTMENTRIASFPRIIFRPPSGIMLPTLS